MSGRSPDDRTLESHPAVRSAAAVGVPDEDLGHRIHAVADVASSATDADELQRRANERLDPEKRIDSLEVVGEPLRDDAGKLRRRDWTPPTP